MERGELQEGGLECEEAHGLVEDDQFSGSVLVGKDVEINFGVNALDSLPELLESIEPEQPPQKGRYNLRKSLAWDSAFFTSAGVLDPEELSSMIDRVDKPEKHLISGIQAEVTGSTESISTLDGDALTLEALEDDLFVDIRASIQRSNRKMSNLMSPSSKIKAKEIDFAVNSALKEKNSTSKNKNQKPSAKKTSVFQSVRASKSQPKENVGKLGTGKQIKPGSAHSQLAQIKSVGKSCEKNPVLPKVSKSISSSIPRAMTTAKREPTVTAPVESECGSLKLAVVSGKATQQPKISAVSGARRVLPKPAVSSKPSQLTSLTSNSVHPLRSSTSSDSSINMPSRSHAKSTAVSSRRNPGKSDNCGTCSLGSFPKTPSRATLKHKQPSPALKTYLMYTRTSSVSPASSISEWSTASSSSTSLVNNTSGISNNSTDGDSSRSIDVHKILDQRSHFAGQTGDGLKSQGTINNSKTPPMQTSMTQTSIKPSGLRMPSPKIGFFDGGKSSARTPNGHQQPQSGLLSGIPKNAIATNSPCETSNMKSESDNISPATTVVASSATLDSPKRTSPSYSLGGSNNATAESCQKVEKVHTEDLFKHAMDADEITGSEVIVEASFDWCNASGLEYIDLTGDSSLVNQNILEKCSPQKNTVSSYSTFGTSNAKSKAAKISPVLTGVSPSVRPDYPKTTSPCLALVDGDSSGESFQKMKKFQVEDRVKQIVDADTSAVIKEKIHNNMGSEDPGKASFDWSNVSGLEHIDQAGDSNLVSRNILENICPIICNDTSNGKIPVKYEEVKQMVRADTSPIVKENIHKTDSKGISSEASSEWSNVSGLEHIDQAGDSNLVSRNILENICPIICNDTSNGKIPVKYEEVKQMVRADTSPIVKENIHKTDSKGISSEASSDWSNASGLECIDQTVTAALKSQTILEMNCPLTCSTTEDQGEGLWRDDRDALQIISDALECRLNSPSKDAESAGAAHRTPFAPKNSLYTTERFGTSKEKATQYAVPDKAGLVMQLSEHKEN